MGNHLGSFSKGGSDFRVPRDMLAAQLDVVDISVDLEAVGHVTHSNLFDETNALPDLKVLKM